MSALDRKPIFATVKALRGGKPWTLAEVQQLDAAIDAALAGVTVPPPVPCEPPTIPARLQNPAGFYDALRSSKPLGPDLNTQEVTGCEAINTACEGWPVSWVAYALATAYHETAGTMQPIREYGKGKGRKYGVPGKYGQVPYGRGYVQLTWDFNYEKADEELELKGALLKDFDLAMAPPVASQILRRGMDEGWFTRKRLRDFLPATGIATTAQFVACRPIINGTDKAGLIAGHALAFQKALVAGQWG